ncbi:MAG TPA: histidine phosphatase family protein [Candidatus Paceibacterota bacterium]|nr:histidine phosphatase family protein [Candidatus Paceibacterota bacterium]
MDVSSFLITLDTITGGHGVVAGRVFIAVVFVLDLIYLLRALRTKRFYIVRHGQTILNAKRIRQGSAGGLDEAGKHQAHAAGAYLRDARIEKIIASPFERTKETAAIIDTYLKVPVTYSPLLGERRNPSEIIGKSAEDAKVEQIVDQIDLSYHDDNYRFSDEENFADLKRRAKRCLSFLGNQSDRSVCVVTHSIFLKMLLSFLLYRNKLHAPDYVKLAFFNPADNGGITICEYRPWKFFSKTRGWSVVAYNEMPTE